MSKTLVLYGLAWLAVLAAFLLPCLPALDRYVTANEPKWMMHFENFYHVMSPTQTPPILL